MAPGARLDQAWYGTPRSGMARFGGGGGGEGGVGGGNCSCPGPCGGGAADALGGAAPGRFEGAVGGVGAYSGPSAALTVPRPATTVTPCSRSGSQRASSGASPSSVTSSTAPSGWSHCSNVL